MKKNGFLRRNFHSTSTEDGNSGIQYGKSGGPYYAVCG